MVEVFKIENLRDLLEVIISDLKEHSDEVKQSNEVKQSKKSSERSDDLYDYLKDLAYRKKCSVEKVAGWLDSIAEISPMAAFSIALREIAVELDKKYPDHINNCDEVIVLSTLDGRLHKVAKAQIKNYRNFAAFRTMADAKFACRILRGHLKQMFGSDREQKD
jgi:hypothetical protein